MFERYSYRYSRWDDSQQFDPFTADDLVDAMAEKLIEDGDLWRALRDMYRHGDRGALDNRLTGMRELMERLRRMREQQLQRHDLNSIMDDIKQRLEDIVQTEQSGIDRRLQEAGVEPRREGEQLEAPQSSPREGQEQQADEGLRQMLQQMAQRHRDQLQNLPQDVPGQLKELSDYDFMDAEAREKFQELMSMLQQQVMQSYFQGMQQAIQSMTPEDLARTREMVRDLNQMLEDRIQGREPKFNEFMDKYGDMFPGVKNLDELLEQLAARMAAMSSLMQSMSPEMRQQLQDMMDNLIGDDRLRADMMRLAANLAQLMPYEDMEGDRYPFSGDQPLTLMEAMAMMERLRDMDALEGQMQQAMGGQGIEDIDADRVRDLIDAEAAAQLEQLQQITKMLEEAGYIQRNGDQWEMTPKAMRRIGQKALRDIFSSLKRDSFGKHETEIRGLGGERIDETKPYEFGDPFLIDIKGTMMNTLSRTGTGTPLRVAPNDFEVYRNELLTQSATVLMLDKSRSMFLNNCFVSAKKVAMALDALIRSQFPRDLLYLVEFSMYARQIQPTELPLITWSDYEMGTNFHHGIMVARRLLARSKAVNKQIIIVTDGEPTAHIEGGEAEFYYPPTQRCIVETLREVLRATRDNIVINTFMLETTPWLTSFVDQMTTINRGRAFYASPDQLGEYILVDYVRNKKKKVS
jgi:uncharacterized protein with von Willebrand factor type A (vWA) domain